MRTLPSLAALLSIALASPAVAQSYDEAYRSCLLFKIEHASIADGCTIVIDSGRLSPLERAYALNNRAHGPWAHSAKAALADFEEAIRLAPHVAMLFRNRSGWWPRKPGFARALADLDQAIRLDPLFAVAYEERGEVYAELKRYDLAIRDFSEAIRLAPTYMHPMYNPYEQRARAKEKTGDLKGAEADRKQQQVLWPGNRIDWNKDEEVHGIWDSKEPNVGGARSWEGWLTK
jgi:tetratricopeptide (TPR) repeat protein